MQLGGQRGSGNIQDRRGMGVGGGLGIGGVIIAIVAAFLGLDPSAVLNTVEQVAPQTTQGQQAAPKQGTPEDEMGQFVAKVLGSTEDVWKEIFRNGGQRYQEPTLVLYTQAVRSACGSAQSAMGPFYCPGDRKVYLDTSFFREMRTRFNACPTDRGSCAFAQAYVIAHEVGHHVQNILGILPKVNQARQQSGDVESNALSVRTELQADCFAGVWANKTQQRFNFIEEGDVEAALRTAEAIGDDMLQKQAQGYVVPDSFTHGSAAQRKRWFTVGLESGKLSSCNTFNARQL